MNVYVVECGVYTGSYVAGVFATLEAAQRDLPVEEWREFEGPPRSWTNGLDWGEHAEITEYVLVTAP